MRQQIIRRRTATNAFTLIELLVVIVILAILATVVITRVTHKVDDAREAKAMADVRSLSDSLEQYKLDIGHYPPTLTALVTNEEQSEKWRKPYVAKVPTDPWGKEYAYVVPGPNNKEFEISTTSPEGHIIQSD
jgi:general secretion pathway protein G